MTDVIYISVIIVFFAAAIGYLAQCERLKKGGKKQ